MVAYQIDSVELYQGGTYYPVTLERYGVVPFVPTPTEDLWFYMEPRAPQSPLVLGHYFGPYPVSINDTTNPEDDYYALNYLKITGEGGLHADYGGLLRDRPFPRDQRGGSFYYADAVDVIVDAKAAGLDGFYVNLMGTSSWFNTSVYHNLRDAAIAEHPDFYVIPMMDAYAMGSQTAAQYASLINDFKDTSLYLPDGRMLVGTFKMEGRSTAHWLAVEAACLSTYGISVAWVAVFNNYPANIASYSSALGSSIYASGNWGSGADINFVSTYASTAASYGHVHHAPWWWQDNRPKNKLFDENRGTAVHRAYANRIVADASGMVQVATYSDYSEESQFCRSARTGRAILDLTAYEVSRIRRGGVEPATLVDTVFLAHRNRTAATTAVTSPTGAQDPSDYMVHWTGGIAGRPSTGASTPTYDAEVITFLTAASDTDGVEVTIAGSTSTFTATAGRNVFRVALTAHATPPAVVVKRGGVTVCSVTSPIVVRSESWQQTQGQFVMGSNRTLEQFDPTQTNTGATPTYP